MDRYVTLLGAEQVERAASSMRQSASEMQRAASNIEHALSQHERFMTEWIERFEAALEKKEAK